MFAGARIIKTGIAVALSLFICNYFNIQPSLFAGAATVLNMQPSLGLSLYNAREQLLVHFLSVSIAILLGLTIGTSPLSIGLSTIIIIQLCKIFKWRGGISAGVMAAIFVLASPNAEFLNHALVRSLAIFVGVSVALVVNLTIAPPRYRQPLQKKLVELNMLVSQHFCEAVQGFLHLSLPTAEEKETMTKKIENLFRESQHLYDLYRFDIGPHTEKQENKQEVVSRYFNEYLAYNKGLWQRTRDVLFLAEERKERRKKAGNLPISPEFQEVLDLLSNALDIFVKNNDELKNKLENRPFVQVDEPRIWCKMDDILNRWHDSFPSGSYRLHALIEVSLVTYKIRWAAREAARLLNEELPAY
ncbi:MAG: aromatic acid exporter family protein [Peptococcaceae bacterium]|jgi:uncharacterized membrane protein YgaE (UPF0421/DUF939 family)|nr:aromatic acid exporter family protein [Peptococcaceae bacterium]MDH7524176.1 aromatic acid exporter family protein [Peptococcaceae bacterium]